MDRAFSSGASGSAPTAPASPSVGYPTAGNPSTGTPATKPGPYWYHMITEELMAIIGAAGITPTQGSLTQLLTAFRSVGVFQTQPQFDNSSKAATTGFIQRALGNFRSLVGFATSITLTAADSGQLIAATAAGTTFTLPLLTSGPSGMSFSFHCNNTAGSVNIACAGADTIQYGSKSISLIVLKTGDAITLTTDGGTSWTPVSQSAGVGKQSFAAMRSTTVQVIAASTWTKIQFNNKIFDQYSVFDAVANFRFQPTIPGKYLIQASVGVTSGASPAGNPGLILAIYKNGLLDKSCGPMRFTSSAYQGMCMSSIVDANGNGDYFEAYAFQDTGISMSITAGGETHFSSARIV